MRLVVERRISPSEWLASKSLRNDKPQISTFVLELPASEVAYLLFLAPRDHFFAEFGFYRPFQLALYEWQTTDEYEAGEAITKAAFKHLTKDRSKLPGLGEQAYDRLHVAVPLRRVDDLASYFSDETDQLGDDSIGRGKPWEGSAISDCPDPRWVLAMTEWTAVRGLSDSERLMRAEGLAATLASSTDPKVELPLNMAARIAVSLAVRPMPPSGQFAPSAQDFSAIHLVRAKIVQLSRSPSFVGAAMANLQNAIAEEDHQPTDKKELIASWRCTLGGYLEEMRSRYPFLARSEQGLFE